VQGWFEWAKTPGCKPGP